MSNPDASSERERGDPGGKEWDEFGVSTLTVAPHAEDREKTVEGTRVFPPPAPGLPPVRPLFLQSQISPQISLRLHLSCDFFGFFPLIFV